MRPGASSTFCQTSPVQILDKVASMSAGGSSRACHALAVKEDGSLWGWGSNQYGQLGDSPLLSVSIPTRLDTGVRSAVAGGEFSLAFKEGSVMTWGSNSSGQLGVPAQGGGSSSGLPTPAPSDPPSPQRPDPYVQTVTAYARTQDILLDGETVTFQAYALKDAKGYETNYVKLRDAAFAINGSASQFQVEWSQTADTSILTSQPYTSNGSEMHTPYSGDRQGRAGEPTLLVNGREVKLSAILLTDDKGGGYTYFKLRDLGRVLGFNVGWDKEKGQVYIETGKSYTG